MATSRILLDVGGTFIKCSDGRQVPVPSGGTAGSIADALKEAIFVSEGPVEVGVAIPGPFDFRKGIFLMKHNFA
ncbi:MAG: ROK family protein, partial [Bacteroidales bacterium]|nr:ROK family protein [Bacteroidales bacterium]